MKTMPSTAERLRGDAPFYFVKSPHVSISLLGTCKFCGSITYLGVCTACNTAVVCSGCKRVRVDRNHWIVPMEPIGDNASHGICRSCFEELHPDVAKRMGDKQPHAFEVSEFRIYTVTLHRTRRERIEEWRREKVKASTARPGSHTVAG